MAALFDMRDVSTSFSFTVRVRDEKGESDLDLLVWKWRGSEALSQTYRFEIDLASKDMNLAYGQLLGCRATLRVQGNGASVWHGVLTQVQLTGVETGADVHDGGASYLYLRVVLEPQMALLRQDVVSRVHTLTENAGRKELSYLIRHALGLCELKSERVAPSGSPGAAEGPFDYALRLGAKVDAWTANDFFFQFEESTLDFLSRHLEHRGVYYWFEQGEKREEVVFFGAEPNTPANADDPTKVKGVSWQARDSLQPDFSGPALYGLEHRCSIFPRSVQVDDFNPDNALLTLKTVNDVPAPQERAGQYRSWGAVAQFGGHQQSQEDSRRLAGLRVEEQVCWRNRYEAVGLASGIHAGQYIHLKDHPIGQLNQDYLVVEISHEGEQALPHKVESEAQEGSLRLRSALSIVPAGIRYRPPRLTRRPYVSSMVSAIVEAAPKEPAPVSGGGPDQTMPATANGDKSKTWVKPYLNEDGKYRIRFLLAENAQAGGTNVAGHAQETTGKNSAWVRMATPYAGREDDKDGDFGMYFPLKEGAEVLVAFIDGDPDRPVIVAAVPNSRNLALATSKNETNMVSGFVMPGGNTLAFMNKEDRQTVFMGSPVSNSYLVMGGDASKAENRGILLSTQDHISLVANSTKTIVEGKGFDRVYSLLPDTSEAKSQKDAAAEKGKQAKEEEEKKKYIGGLGKKGKFEADWLHPDSGYSFSIEKPKLSAGASIAMSAEFSAKLGFKLGVNVGAAYALEFSHSKSYNFLEKNTTEKESELKIQTRSVTAVEDNLVAGKRKDVVLQYAAQYGAYRETTKAVHHVEAEGGLFLASVKSVPAMPDTISKDTVAEPATSLLARLLAPLNPAGLKKSWNKLRPAEENDVPAAKLKSIVAISQNASMQVRKKDDSVLALHSDGFTLYAKKYGKLDTDKSLTFFSDTLSAPIKTSVDIRADAVKLTMSKTSGATLDGAGKSVAMKTGGNSITASTSGVEIKGTGQCKIGAQIIKLG